ncbi:hypothetical protein [Hoeflea phototrophica]|nr:hypothetical protein [Hoeflea phototrophica]
MSVAEQALKSEENVIDISVNSEFIASSPGIYRLSKSKNGNYRLLSICPKDTNLQMAFKAIEIFGKKSSDKLIDEDASDYFSFTVNPVQTERNIEGVLFEAGLKFNGIPKYKRIVEGYSVSGQKRVIAELDDVLSANFVEDAMGEKCSEHVSNPAGFTNRGKPVYVFEIAKADKIYTDLVNLPTISASAAKGDVKRGDIELKIGEGWRTEKANNAVFGIKYFSIGPLKDRPIPTTKF